MAPNGQESLYSSLSSEKWWLKNLTANYAFSKADTKDLLTISKDLDLASTTILSLSISVSGSSAGQSIENLKGAIKFFRTGGAFLEVRGLLNDYKNLTIVETAELQKQISLNELELGYVEKRLKQYEELKKRYPSSSDVGTKFMIDGKDGNSKFLPIDAQIIACNTDVNRIKEVLERLRGQLIGIETLKSFNDEAEPLMRKNYDGLALIKQLLGIVSKMQLQLSGVEFSSKQQLTRVNAELLSINEKYETGLSANAPPVIKKVAMVKTIVFSIFLILSILLGWHIVKFISLNMRKIT
ncbi:hypothetical protein [Polynucleobacter sp. MG-6-Vaara-E2]|uniref:hypothetical protein n=1 Tax=Polynucleobacter sp. MG-6-Vaara-E2 TaxID=2576932 RepID=UPI001BFCE1AF|nr:hypothetical protein [Polynucleobacter sp. MG-6-Vaara-E2]QWD96899.1 hypothetical protein ICV38_01650 [Polynucleobacter sp. MG-6-Vaara-E2]